jgi:hypothetical protein
LKSQILFRRSVETSTLKEGRHKMSSLRIWLPTVKSSSSDLSVIRRHPALPALVRRETKSITPAKLKHAPVITSASLPVPCPLGKKPWGDNTLSSNRAPLARNTNAKIKVLTLISKYHVTAGGGEGIRTPDPRVANAVLCQLSYTP